MESKINAYALAVLASCLIVVVYMVLTGHADGIGAVASGVGLLASALMPKLLDGGK